MGDAPRGVPGARGATPATVRQFSVQDVENSSIGGLKGDHYASQWTGGSRLAQNTNSYIEAMADPAAYMRKRATKINEINLEIDTVFKEKYAGWLSRGDPPNDALARAQNYVMKLSEALFADLDSYMPQNIEQTAANLAFTRSTAGQNNFDPSAAPKSTTIGQAKAAEASSAVAAGPSRGRGRRRK